MNGTEHPQRTGERDLDPTVQRLKSDDRIQQLLASPSVSFWLKDALRAMTNRDPLDALNDAELLVEVLKRTGERDLDPTAQHLKSEDRVQQSLASPSVSFWLKDALRAMTGRDVVDALNDAELLVKVLTARFEEILGSR